MGSSDNSPVTAPPSAFPRFLREVSDHAGVGWTDIPVPEIGTAAAKHEGSVAKDAMRIICALIGQISAGPGRVVLHGRPAVSLWAPFHRQSVAC